MIDAIYEPILDPLRTSRHKVLSRYSLGRHRSPAERAQEEVKLSTWFTVRAAGCPLGCQQSRHGRQSGNQPGVSRAGTGGSQAISQESAGQAREAVRQSARAVQAVS